MFVDGANRWEGVLLGLLVMSLLAVWFGAIIVLIETVGPDTGQSVVLPLVLWFGGGAVVAGVCCGLEGSVPLFREVDRHGVRVRLDQAGIYLGGRRPIRLAWTEVAEVLLFTYPSGEVTCHGVGFRFSDADPASPEHPSPNPFDRGSARTDLAHDAHPKIRAAVRHNAPQLPVRDIGEIRYHRPTPRRQHWPWEAEPTA